MAGVRLRHPDPAFWGASLVVELDLDFANRQPRHCPRCSTREKDVFHDRKSVHLKLEHDGTVIVSEETLAQLATVAYAGMQVENIVDKPPAVKLGAVAAPHEEIVNVPLNRDRASRHHTPGIDKYAAERRLHSALAVGGLKIGDGYVEVVG